MKTYRPNDGIVRSAVLMFLMIGAGFLYGQDLPRKIEPHRVHEGDLFDIGQEIFIQGVLDGDLNVINCQVHLEGTIKGNVSMLGGVFTAEVGARIEGNVVIIGGRFEAPPETVQGKLVHFFDPDPRAAESQYESFASRAAVFCAQTLMLFLLTILVFYIFPNQVHEASFELSQDLVRPAIVGVFTLAVFFIGMFTSFLLMVIGIGFPLFLIFLTALMVIALFGGTVIFYRLGQVFEMFTHGVVALVPGIFLALVLTGLLLSLPVAGAFASLAFALFGAGIVIDTRFGTNKQWFTRKSRYWSAG
jgi:hypothetical protein